MSDVHDDGRPTGRSAAWLARLVRVVETETSLDRRAAAMDAVADPLARSAAGPLLRGAPLGHALHPLLTDLPIGCWTSATLLDLIGGAASRPAARRLTALGLLCAVPTALSGLVDYHEVDDQRTRRVAAAHAGGNAFMVGCQLLSWRARRQQRHVRGAAWGLAGGAVGTLAGYLGGHMAFGQAAAERPHPRPEMQTDPADDAVDLGDAASH